MSGSLRVQTLGMFRVWLNDELLPNVVWKREKAQRLFQFLITIKLNNSHQVLPKERIVAELWPTLDESRADRDFKVALNALNDALEPDRTSRSLSGYILRHGLAYGLDPDANIRIDAEDFRQGLKTAARLEAENIDAAIDAYREAIDCYAGDYLPDALYEDWASLERERLQTLYVSGAMRLAALLLRREGYQEAIHLCQSVLVIDRFWEEAYRLMMIGHVRRGNRPLALRVYEQCRQALAEGLDLEPMDETTTLYEQIKRGEPL
ncbi:MAG TPA: bacterial transcriptional activator domain-containing protein [Aggregatilineaceae bacterium]|nr:bacterial transcriptional activator domain-containing protein [Aggregatilineaceae bacterium]